MSTSSTRCSSDGEDQLDLLYERFRELGYREPDAVDYLGADVGCQRTDKTMGDYRTRRKDLLITLLSSTRTG